MKTRTREQVIETLEEAIEKKGVHLRMMDFTSKEMKKIEDDKSIEKDLKDEAIEDCELANKLNRLKLVALDTKIETLKEMLLQDSIMIIL